MEEGERERDKANSTDLKAGTNEENLEDLVESSGKGGNKLATKAHFEAFRSS